MEPFHHAILQGKKERKKVTVSTKEQKVSWVTAWVTYLDLFTMSVQHVSGERGVGETAVRVPSRVIRHGAVDSVGLSKVWVLGVDVGQLYGNQVLYLHNVVKAQQSNDKNNTHTHTKCVHTHTLKPNHYVTSSVAKYSYVSNILFYFCPLIAKHIVSFF